MVQLVLQQQSIQQVVVTIDVVDLRVLHYSYQQLSAQLGNNEESCRWKAFLIEHLLIELKLELHQYIKKLLIYFVKTGFLALEKYLQSCQAVSVSLSSFLQYERRNILSRINVF